MVEFLPEKTYSSYWIEMPDDLLGRIVSNDGAVQALRERLGDIPGLGALEIEHAATPPAIYFMLEAESDHAETLAAVAAVVEQAREVVAIPSPRP